MMRTTGPDIEIPSPGLSPYQQQLQEAGAFFAQLAITPALQQELNQHGFSKPKRIANILSKCISLPLYQLKFSIPPAAENEEIELWHFDHEVGIHTQTLDISMDSYEQLNELPTYTGDLLRVPEAPQDCLQQLYPKEQRSLINIPMRHQGTHVASFHLATPSPHAFEDNELLLAHTIANMMTPAFANFNLQNKVAFNLTRQRHLLVHYKGLHKVLQQTREAYEAAEGNVTKLKQLCQQLKARAWENQERCSTLEQDLRRSLKRQASMEAKLAQQPEITEPIESTVPTTADAGASGVQNITLPSPTKVATAPPPALLDINELLETANSDEKASQEAGALLREIGGSKRTSETTEPSETATEPTETTEPPTAEIEAKAEAEETAATERTAESTTGTEETTADEEPQAETVEAKPETTESVEPRSTDEPEDSPEETPGSVINVDDLVDEALLQVLNNIQPPPLPDIPSIEISLSEEAGELSIEDLEIEEELFAKQDAHTLLYLSGTPLLPKLAFFEALRSVEVQLNAMQTAEDLLAEIDRKPPMAVALLSLEQSKHKQTIDQGMRKLPAQQTLPIFDVQLPKDKEAIIRMRWGMHQSAALGDRFWRKWIGQVHRTRSGDQAILSIGFPDEKTCASLLHFFCGQQLTMRAYQNPVDGIQSLYQSPPQLLALHLGDSQQTWVPLFQELGSSVRTREVPLMLMSPGPLDEKLQEAIEPFHHLLLTPRTKLA